MAKIRSRNHRKRKKDYIAELEEKNKNLEKTIAKLNQELSFYK